MAKLPVVSEDATDIKDLMAQKRRPEAVTLAVSLLLKGESNPAFLAAVADLLTRRPPSRKAPRDWHKIGEEFEELRRDGATYQDALSDLADRRGTSETGIRRAVTYYLRAVENAHRQ